MKIRQFIDEGLGNTAHLVISEAAGVAALVDPLRDVDRYLGAAASLGVRITHVLETHVHNDFVSGGRELAASAGARTVASAEGGLAFAHQPVRDGDAVVVGDVTFGVLATPGHTPEHVSYLARDSRRPDEPPALFSGGSLLVGAVARTDLLGDEHAARFARDLYRSLHEKVLPLPDDVSVYPTHGAGSFCTATPGAARSTTIGEERRTNPLLRLTDPDDFVAEALHGLPRYPVYFHAMRDVNRRGPTVLGGLPRLSPLSPAAVRDRQAAGEAVVDMRPVRHYAQGHIPGAYHVELRAAFGSWVGWVVPFGTPVLLVSESEDQHEEAVRQLVRIGYDNLPGYLDGGVTAWRRAGLPVAHADVLTMRELHDRLARGEPLVTLDVRQEHEWTAGHLPVARHAEAGALADVELGLPPDTPIAMHCGHGQRAATALSILERRGYRRLHLVVEGVEEWQQAALPVAGGAAERNLAPARP